ncbi:MAG: GtrA family protein [Flavobacteriaceae bacterium]
MRFVTAGLFNTALGLSIIFLLMASGFGDVWSNVIGFAIGIAVSFLLNSRWTFGARGRSRFAFLRFTVVVAIAWLCNLGTLLAVRDLTVFGAHAGQIAGVAVYAAIGFVGMRHFAFPGKPIHG